ncbi:MAG: IS607 family element RNA-guided endonuclease TnpB [Pseudoscardovia radai]|nr:IS607 family element RNA-guided endonuclease TnpB [Pseudoscardovia radai]
MRRRNAAGECTAVRVALDPTPRQAGMLRSHAGGARAAYNAGLAHVRELLDAGGRPGWSMYALRRWWNGAKDSIAPWWAENSKECYSYGLECLAGALKNWSDSRHGRRKGRRVGFPRFKSRRASRPAFAYTTGSFGLVPGDPRALRLPRIGRVHCMEDVASRVGGRRVLRMTVSERSGRWYASLTVEEPPAKPAPVPPERGTVGVDLGIKALATLSDGTVVPNGKPLGHAMRRLKKAQRRLGRMTKGSGRRERQRRRVARLHGRVADVRRDAMHKLTARLSASYSEIHIEDLNVQGMMANHRLAMAVADAGFHELRRQLGYKCRRTGARLVIVDRWYPSSKRCSNCGSVKAKLTLGERTYRCDECGYVADRDLNAAVNLRDWNPPVAGSAPETLNARGGDVGRGASRAVPCETRTKRPDPSGMRLGAAPGNRDM